MASQASYGSSMLFQNMNEELNASLATADELSREFDSLMKECAPNSNKPEPSSELNQRIRINSRSPLPPSSDQEGSGGSSSSTASSSAYMPTVTTRRPGPSDGDLIISDRFTPSDPPPVQRDQLASNYVPRGQLTPPFHSPHTQRRHAPSPRVSSPQIQRRHSPSRRVSSDHSPRGSLTYSPASNPGTPTYDLSPGMILLPTPSLDPTHMGRLSPRRSTSPQPFTQSAASTLPRNFMHFKQTDESAQRPKIHGNWNESDLDVSYERKPNHTYEKTDWRRPSLPKGNWTESNLDGPPPASRKDHISRQLQSHHSSLPRNTHISVAPDQPIISRISIPPSIPKVRQHRPIPLSVIMRLQNPHSAARTHYPRVTGPEGDPAFYFQHLPTRDFQHYYRPQELPQPTYYGEELKPYEVDSELENLDPLAGASYSKYDGPVHYAGQEPETSRLVRAPRPLSPTRLQPVLAPQNQPVPALEELLRIRGMIPRALKRRGSVEQSQPMKKSLVIQPNQYKQMINNLFHKKGLHIKGEPGSDYSSSSDGEENLSPRTSNTAPVPNISVTPENKGLNSILRRKSQKSSGRHARLSPLVLLLDGALVGELDTVQRAVQEMSNPSQPNDEGITALHNAICGGHYAVVDFLVRIGANVSAPDSHGWTPLHCAASCNDKTLCEYLVRSGAAVMAVTESDEATAAQKCDPYAQGYEECENFLRGVECAMGVENSGVLYALWGLSAQASDELSFREGDMVTILQKPEGVDWWWASLCGREGFVPNNYFGLFPKVRPKTLC